MKRILLVEDDERQRESVVHLISDDDVEITAVALGEQALALLKTHLRLHDHRPQAARHAGQRIARTHGTRGTVLLPAGDRLHRPQPEPRGRGGPDKYSRSIIIKGARSPERLLDEVTLFLHKVESELSSERQRMLQQVRSRERVRRAQDPAGGR
jgi:hypothetical protein